MKKNDNNRLEYDKVNFDDDEKITSVDTSDIDNDGVNPDDIKEYVLNDDAIDDEEKDKEKDEDKKKEELKKRILMGIIGAGIIIAILLLAFGLRKNKVAAVLSNDAQDRMIFCSSFKSSSNWFTNYGFSISSSKLFRWWSKLKRFPKFESIRWFNVIRFCGISSCSCW